VSTASVGVETESVLVLEDDTKMGAVIKKLTVDLRDKRSDCERSKEDVERLEAELTDSKKEAMTLRVQLSDCRQQMEDQRVYGWNLQKYLDEKSRNEALLRQQIMAQQQRMEQLAAQQQPRKMTACERQEIAELRELLMASEQKAAEWRRKWKEQSFKMEGIESERIMKEQRSDRQLEEYHAMVHELRNVMSSNLDGVHRNFQKLNEEKLALEKENERLLMELGAVQETAILRRDREHQRLRAEAADAAAAETVDAVDTAERAVQCAEPEDVGRDAAEMEREEMRSEREHEVHALSQHVYDLIVSLKANANEIGDEFGMGPADQMMARGHSLGDEQFGPLDTDDVDGASVTLSALKRLRESKLILEALLKWFDDVMCRHAERQSDQCITQ